LSAVCQSPQSRNLSTGDERVSAPAKSLIPNVPRREVEGLTLMPFEHDIFISYGHIDDEDPYGDDKGWVDLLFERLPKLVQGHLGDPPRVWRDERSLQGNDELREAIRAGVTRSLLFVPVVSPRYVLSDWCRTELETFCAAEPPPHPSASSFRSRVFKVVKTPLLLPQVKDKEPAQLRELLGYQFYEMEGDMPREFNPHATPGGTDSKYWETLTRLAWHIAKKLSELKYAAATSQPSSVIAPSAATAAPAAVAANATAVVAPPATESKYVYLAETTSDLAEQRERVRDELQQRGHVVLPDSKLPLSTPEIEEAVRSHLARCALSVHLVGKSFGFIPEGEDEENPRSAIRIQEELAAARGASDSSFKRLLWLPPGLEPAGARQKAYVNELQNRITAGAELLQTSLEDLKTRILEKLNPAPKPAARASGPASLKHVYLICDNRDKRDVQPIKRHLFQEKFEVITLADEGDSKQLAEFHRENLLSCEAALIYYGNADERWVMSKLRDLERAYGLGRTDEWEASAVYIAAPPTEDKEYFMTHAVPLVIQNFDAFKPDQLEPFVEAAKSGNGG
jgi:hypothetical protein